MARDATFYLEPQLSRPLARLRGSALEELFALTLAHFEAHLAGP